MDFLSSIFDPQNYAGVTGLLDRLKPAMSFPTNPSPGFGAPPAAAPAQQGGVMDANAQLPANAMPTSGSAPLALAPAPAPDTSPGFLDGLRGKISDNSNMLLGLAAGIAGGKNWGDGISKGLTLAMQGGQLDTKTGNSTLTARALLAKGVDPQTVQAAISNPELMRTIITQTYGPKTVQSLGNGYIAQDGKVTRAYEPDDKIPIGFQKTDKGLEPIPGGPADPAYIRTKAIKEQDPNAIHVLGRGGELYKTGPDGNPVIVHKNEAETAVLDDATTSAMASQYLAGDKSVMQNLGRGAQGAANVVKLRNEIYKQARNAGLDGRDIVDNFNEQAGALAGQRAVGTRAANISLAANEANNMIPIALAASDKLPRSQYMPWNKMVQAVQKGSSSPELASFVAATNSLVNSYVRAVSPSGVPTDSMREHAYSMLNAAQGPEAYKAVIDTMKQEMNAALEAPSQVKKELRHKSENAPASQSAAPKPGNYVWTPNGGLVGAK